MCSFQPLFPNQVELSMVFTNGGEIVYGLESRFEFLPIWHTFIGGSERSVPITIGTLSSQVPRVVIAVGRECSHQSPVGALSSRILRLRRHPCGQTMSPPQSPVEALSNHVLRKVIPVGRQCSLGSASEYLYRCKSTLRKIFDSS